MAPRPLTINARSPAALGLPAFKGDKSGVEAIVRANKFYVENLKTALYAIPKYAAGSLAASALDAAVMLTKHDSGRFAANWNLSLNGRIPDKMPDPLRYETSGPKFGALNKRGSRKFNLAVIMAKRAYYGYKPGTQGFMQITNGRLAAALYKGLSNAEGTKINIRGANRGGATPKILLYNPFATPNRRAGFDPLYFPHSKYRKYETYPFYALHGQEPGEFASHLRTYMGKGEVLAYIQKLKRLIGSSHNKLIDPFTVGFR